MASAMTHYSNNILGSVRDRQHPLQVNGMEAQGAGGGNQASGGMLNELDIFR